MSDSFRPIFIIGCPRSGTTLLQLMLHSHRRIALPAETRFVHTAYQRRLAFGDLEDPANRTALAEWITGRPQSKFETMGLDPEAVNKEIRDAPPTLGSALATVFRGYARQHEKPRWGDKRPSYFRKVSQLRRMFPDAQFVHLIRDGRDAVSSLKAMPWYAGDIYTATLTWREAIDKGNRLARKLGPQTYYQFRYEDLVAEPEAQLRGLCGFLGEEFDPGMLEYNRLADATVPPEREWHARTHEAVNARRIGSWRDRLEPWEVNLTEFVLKSHLTELGYEPAGAPRPSAAELTRFEKAAARRVYIQRRQAASEIMRRMREPNPVTSLLHGSALDAAPE